MQNRQAPTFFERGRLRQPCASAPQKWCIDRSWPFGSSVGFGVAGNGAEHVVERSRRTINPLIEGSGRRRIHQAVKRWLAMDCDGPSSEAIHSRVTRAVYFGGLSPGTEMHIATWLVAVPWRNSFIGAFSGEFQNLRSDASSGKRTSAVRAPTGQLPSKTSLASTTSSTSPPYLAIAALVLAT